MLYAYTFKNQNLAKILGGVRSNSQEEKMEKYDYQPMINEMSEFAKSIIESIKMKLVQLESKYAKEGWQPEVFDVHFRQLIALVCAESCDFHYKALNASMILRHASFFDIMSIMINQFNQLGWQNAQPIQNSEENPAEGVSN